MAVRLALVVAFALVWSCRPIPAILATRGAAPCCVVLRYAVDPAFGPNEIGPVADGIEAWRISTGGEACFIRDESRYDVAILRASSRFELVAEEGPRGDWAQHLGLLSADGARIWLVVTDLSADVISALTAHEVGHALLGSYHARTGEHSVMTPILGELERHPSAPPTLPVSDVAEFERHWACR